MLNYQAFILEKTVGSSCSYMLRCDNGFEGMFSVQQGKNKT